VDEVLAFPPDGNRHELVGGELLVTPSPSQQHQIVLEELYFLLREYVHGYQTVARSFLSPADIIWGPDDYVQPDMFVVPAHEVTGDWRDCQTLWLVVEVLSAGSARYDRVTKRLLYQRKGVATYWTVDIDARLAEVWHPGDDRPEIVTDVLRWRVTPDAAELEIHLEEVFRALPAQR
jgi:Uma2 family endonuclease